MSRTLSIAVAAGLLLFAGWAAVAEDGPKEDPTKAAMQLKLELAQNILEGITLEDFDQISQNAEKMKTLVKVEQWLHRDTREYKAQLQIFQFANDEQIIEAAIPSLLIIGISMISVWIISVRGEQR